MIEVERVDELPSALALSARMSQFDGFMALCPVSLDSVALGQVRDVLGLWSMQGNLTGAAILSETSNAPDVEASNAANALLHLIALGRKWGAQRKGIGFRPHSDEHN
jgi:6,7-dimethyl-8-ribityllumazine synthase